MSWTTKDPAAPVWRLVVTDETASFGLTPAALKGSARQFVELLRPRTRGNRLTLGDRRGPSSTN